MQRGWLWGVGVAGLGSVGMFVLLLRTRSKPSKTSEAPAPPKPVQFFSHDFDWETVAARVGPLVELEAQQSDTIHVDIVDAAAWEKFFQFSKERFYKNRNYLPQLVAKEIGERPDQDSFVMVELGCGAGNSVFPILHHLKDCNIKSISVHAVDFSPTAIKCVVESPQFDPLICTGHVHDITSMDLVGKIGNSSVDLVVFIFSLSAIPREKMPDALCVAAALLKPGGTLLIRDYGLYDLAHERFVVAGNKRAERVGYVRGDNTRAYFLSKEELSELCAEHFTPIEVDYHTVRLKNRKTSEEMNRVWVHGKFVRKPNSGQY